MNEPSPAQRLRSLLCSASSLDVVAAGRRVSLLDGHAVDAHGRLTIEVPADSALALELAEGPLPAVVEVTDVSPVAMRNRIRARATFIGGLRPHRGTTTHFDMTTVELTERGVTTHVPPAEFAAAEPDLLATREAALLCHLVDAHADLVSWLSRLVPVERLHGVTRVHPLHLDRFGIVLRLEFPSRDRDVRLPFSQPVRAVEDAPGRMLELLARARTCRRRVA